MAELAGNPVAHLTEYELRHLAEHLEASGHAEKLHCLLTLETSAQRSAWYEAREAIGDTFGYLSDVERAWRLAETERNVGQQIRYALVLTSFNSLATQIPPLLITGLVKAKLWSLEQAMVYAQQVVDDDQRARVLTELSFEAPPDQRPHIIANALAATLAIAEDFTRASRLHYLVLMPNLPLALWNDALRAARELARDSGLVRPLVALARHLEPERACAVLRDVLEESRREYEQIRAEAMAILVTKLAEGGHIREGTSYQSINPVSRIQG